MGHLLTRMMLKLNEKSGWVPYSVMGEDSRFAAKDAVGSTVIVELEIARWFLVEKGIV